MSFDLAGALRRLKPEKRVARLDRRHDDELSFVGSAPAAGPALLLDTSVYIDALQDRLPAVVEGLLISREVNHSAIALAELAHPLGRLDPAHPETAAVSAAIRAAIQAIPPHRLSAPSGRVLAEAGIVTGILARLRGTAKTDRQPLLNDAVLYLHALDRGFCLLSRNIVDLDLVEQLVPGGRVLFYRRDP
ncbi:type II toxin-antitoxin system VapC family toxin [Methylobacterium oryzisoli]|uniref:type II toxin-antitoxin system VapC family toxin n=1 Tax=Methylobacterium oryzisoli TaxID=3385502 RepID=UPI003892AE56